MRKTTCFLIAAFCVALNSASIVTCPTSGSVNMNARDWCTLNCTLPATLTYSIDFGKGKEHGVPNLGNVEIVDLPNFKRFLNNDPTFTYQKNASQVASNVPHAGPIAIDGPIAIIQCANVASACGEVKIDEWSCKEGPAPGPAPPADCKKYACPDDKV